MAGFSFNEFYQRNRRVVIWVILFLLLWLLRDFFGLVFLTFVLAIIAAPLAEFGVRRVKLPHWLSLSIVYFMFLLVLASFVRFVAPSVASEVNRMIGNLPQTEMRLIEVKNRLLDNYPTLRQPLNGYLRSMLPEERTAGIEQQLIVSGIASRSPSSRWSRPRRVPRCPPERSPSYSIARISFT